LAQDTFRLVTRLRAPRYIRFSTFSVFRFLILIDRFVGQRRRVSAPPPPQNRLCRIPYNRFGGGRTEKDPRTAGTSPSACQLFAPIAARFMLVDTEGWFWIRIVGAPRDGDSRDGELHQPTREGATFAATQWRQNSLPSMSCITRHDSLSPSAGSSRTRTAPSAISRVHSASSAARRASARTMEEQGMRPVAEQMAARLFAPDPGAELTATVMAMMLATSLVGASAAAEAPNAPTTNWS
jgi:hypothetical protein